MGYNNCERDVNEPYMVNFTQQSYFCHFFTLHGELHPTIMLLSFHHLNPTSTDSFGPGTHQQAEEGRIGKSSPSSSRVLVRETCSLYQINHFVPVQASFSLLQCAFTITWSKRHKMMVQPVQLHEVPCCSWKNFSGSISDGPFCPPETDLFS